MSSRDEPSGWAIGWTYFAGFMMIMVGGFQMLAGFAAILNDDRFVTGAGEDLVFKFSTNQWGWITSSSAGHPAGRARGLQGRGLGADGRCIMAVLSALSAFAYIPIYPIWGIMIAAVSIAVIWALTAHGRDVAELEHLTIHPRGRASGAAPRCSHLRRPTSTWRSTDGSTIRPWGWSPSPGRGGDHAARLRRHPWRPRHPAVRVLPRHRGPPRPQCRVRDLDQVWYLRGIRGLGDTVAAAAAALREEVGGARLVTTGNSAGGFGAIAFGALLGASEVHAFSPQTASTADTGPVARRTVAPAGAPRPAPAGRSRAPRSPPAPPGRGRPAAGRPARDPSPHRRVARAGRAPRAAPRGVQGVEIHRYAGAGHRLVTDLRDDGELARILRGAVA